MSNILLDKENYNKKIMKYHTQKEKLLSNGPDKKERTKRSEHVGMQKGANFTIVSTIVLIGLNTKFYEIFAKQHVC